MKIRTFAVNNFRGICGGLDSNRIVFNDINILFIFGQNNVGKSTFLKAYEFFYQDAQATIDDFNRKQTTQNIEMEIEVELDEADRARIEEAAPKAKDSYKKYLIDDKYLRLKSEWTADKKTPKIKHTHDPATGKYEPIGYASVGLHNVFQSCMPRPIFIKAMPTEEEAKAILNKILTAMAESRLEDEELQELKDAREKIEALQQKMYNKDVMEKYKTQVNDQMRRLFPEVAIDITDKADRMKWTENKLGKEYDISFLRTKNDGNIDNDIPTSAALIGHGTIRAAIFTLLMMRDIAEEFERKEGRKDYLVLFEEPELFLFPKALRQLRELIYSVSAIDTPYQVVCASHSPAMIDISKVKSSIVRLIREFDKTQIHQVSDEFLKTASGKTTEEEFKQEMHEVLRFNPHICEAFYADEVILVEGPTEEILLRGLLQIYNPDKFYFVLNCGSVTNIPFYQQTLGKFRISYSVICDTDSASLVSVDHDGNPAFDRGIQKTISDQFANDKAAGNCGIMRCHNPTFEPAHRDAGIPEKYRMPDKSAYGKPYDANEYWKKVIKPNIDSPDIETLPFVKTIKMIVGKK